MKITSLKNENGARIYHVIDDGCIQEFWTYKSAQEYVEYITRLNEVTLEEAINAYLDKDRYGNRCEATL